MGHIKYSSSLLSDVYSFRGNTDSLGLESGKGPFSSHFWLPMLAADGKPHSAVSLNTLKYLSMWLVPPYPMVTDFQGKYPKTEVVWPFMIGSCKYTLALCSHSLGQEIKGSF